MGTKKIEKSLTEYDFPVYGTQGGGLARRSGETFIFVEAPPEGMGLNVGDEVPDMWDLQPANKAAREVEFAQQFANKC